MLDDSDDTPFDCGAVATALVNAACSRGLGAVINSRGIMQSPVVREHAGIADDQVIMKSIALGWPDEGFPANAVVSEEDLLTKLRCSSASRTRRARRGGRILIKAVMRFKPSNALGLTIPLSLPASADRVIEQPMLFVAPHDPFPGI